MNQSACIGVMIEQVSAENFITYLIAARNVRLTWLWGFMSFKVRFLNADVCFEIFCYKEKPMSSPWSERLLIWSSSFGDRWPASNNKCLRIASTPVVTRIAQYLQAWLLFICTNSCTNRFGVESVPLPHTHTWVLQHRTITTASIGFNISTTGDAAPRSEWVIDRRDWVYFICDVVGHVSRYTLLVTLSAYMLSYCRYVLKGSVWARVRVGVRATTSYGLRLVFLLAVGRQVAVRRACVRVHFESTLVLAEDWRHTITRHETVRAPSSYSSGVCDMLHMLRYLDPLTHICVGYLPLLWVWASL